MLFLNGMVFLSNTYYYSHLINLETGTEKSCSLAEICPAGEQHVQLSNIISLAQELTFSATSLSTPFKIERAPLTVCIPLYFRNCMNIISIGSSPKTNKMAILYLFYD